MKNQFIEHLKGQRELALKSLALLNLAQTKVRHRYKGQWVNASPDLISHHERTLADCDALLQKFKEAAVFPEE